MRAARLTPCWLLTLVALAEAREHNSQKGRNKPESLSTTHVSSGIYQRRDLGLFWPTGKTDPPQETDPPVPVLTFGPGRGELLEDGARDPSLALRCGDAERKEFG